MLDLKILTFCVCIGLVYGDKKVKEFPSDIQKCHRGDNQCIQNAIQYITNNYPQGLPALNLPSIEPLRWKKFDITHLRDDHDDDDNEKVSIDWKITNIELTGFSRSKYTVKGFEKDIGTSNVTIIIEMPKFIAVGDYKLKSRFKKRRSHGKGRFKCDFDNIDFILNFIPTTVTIKGKEYLKIKHISVDYITRKVDISFGDLFDGNKDLSDKEHKHFNTHGTEFFNQIREVTGAEWSLIYTEIFDNIFEKHSVNELFLD